MTAAVNLNLMFMNLQSVFKIKEVWIRIPRSLLRKTFEDRAILLVQLLKYALYLRTPRLISHRSNRQRMTVGDGLKLCFLIDIQLVKHFFIQDECYAIFIWHQFYLG